MELVIFEKADGGNRAINLFFCHICKNEDTSYVNFPDIERHYMEAHRNITIVIKDGETIEIKRPFVGPKSKRPKNGVKVPISKRKNHQTNIKHSIDKILSKSFVGPKSKRPNMSQSTNGRIFIEGSKNTDIRNLFSSSMQNRKPKNIPATQTVTVPIENETTQDADAGVSEIPLVPSESTDRNDSSSNTTFESMIQSQTPVDSATNENDDLDDGWKWDFIAGVIQEDLGINLNDDSLLQEFADVVEFPPPEPTTSPKEQFDEFEEVLRTQGQDQK